MKTSWKILTTCLLIVVLLGVSGILLKTEEEKKVVESVKGLVNYSVYPAVINLAPNEAFADVQYRYDLSVVDQDTPKEKLSIKLLEHPLWLDTFGLTIFGTPTDFNLGTNKIVYQLTDGIHSVTETFYVVVSKSNEGN